MIGRFLSLLLFLLALGGCRHSFPEAEPDGPMPVDSALVDRRGAEGRLPESGSPPDARLDSSSKKDGSPTLKDTQVTGEAGGGTITIQPGQKLATVSSGQHGWAPGFQPPASGELFVLCGVTNDARVSSIAVTNPSMAMTPVAFTPRAEIWQGATGGTFTNNTTATASFDKTATAGCVAVVASGAAPIPVNNGSDTAVGTEITGKPTVGVNQVVLAVAAANQTISPVASPLKNLGNLSLSSDGVAAGYASGKGGQLSFTFSTAASAASWALAWVVIKPK